MSVIVEIGELRCNKELEGFTKRAVYLFNAEGEGPGQPIQRYITDNDQGEEVSLTPEVFDKHFILLI